MSNITTIRVSGQTYTISDSRLAEVEEVTAAALNYLEENKQDTLSAGTGIQISGNVISATGGGGGGNNVIEVTQAEYDALVSAGTLDLTALYVITDATEIDINNYWTSAQTQSAITQAVSGKQDTLIAGDNITISGNVISASGGTIDSSLNSGSTNAVANSAITVALNALNDKFDGMKLKRISQSDYDALVSAGTVDASTLYIITQ